MIRKCLKCDKNFKSKGNYNRICGSCVNINSKKIEVYVYKSDRPMLIKKAKA